MNEVTLFAILVDIALSGPLGGRGVSQPGFRPVERKYLIIFHGLGKGICCALTPVN